jgi:hypothetical protein
MQLDTNLRRPVSTSPDRNAERHLLNLPSLVRFSRPHHEDWRGDALTIELQGDGIRQLDVRAVAAT